MNYFKRKKLNRELMRINCKIVGLQMDAFDGKDIEQKYSKLKAQQDKLIKELGYNNNEE